MMQHKNKEQFNEISSIRENMVQSRCVVFTSNFYMYLYKVLKEPFKVYIFKKNLKCTF